MKKIPVAGPSITDLEIAYVNDAVANAWYSDANIYHERFEQRFAAYVSRRFAMALPSCTSAIHLALLALGIGPGDEVIVPDITWIATAAPISYVGATPVFADIDSRSWCLSADAMRERVTRRTKAVIAVDLYGNMADYDAIQAIADENGISVVEDAAQAIGGAIGSRRAGSFGTVSVFSFHGSKTLTTGEGGMLVTDDEDLFRRAGVLRDHGRVPGDPVFFNREVAYKYKMSALQAALGLAQLERIEELIAMKRAAFNWYASGLRGVDAVTLNYERPGTSSTYWMNTMVVDPQLGMTKELLRERLSERGIDSRPFFYPLSELPAYAHLTSKLVNRNAAAISPYGLNLPSSLALTRKDVELVCEALRDIVRH